MIHAKHSSHIFLEQSRSMGSHSQGFHWVQATTHSPLPVNAVFAGQDLDGSPIYVGRAFHEGDLIPAKVIPSKHAAYVSFSGGEHLKHQFEILCGSGFTWVVSANGHVPPHAVEGGMQSNGERLFIGRTHYDGALCVGKIHPAHGCIYVPFDGAERSVQQYEVLISNRTVWKASTAHSSVPEGAIEGGRDQDGTLIYVGRAYHEGDQIPAKVLPQKNAAYVPYGGREHLKHQYEILCYGNVSWVHTAHGHVPPNAVPGGTTADGEILYIGRAHHEGSLTVGKVQASHGTLYIPFGGREVAIKDYEILVEH